MVKFVKRLVARKKGMEVLQVILTLALALFIAKNLLEKGRSAANTAGDNMNNFVGGK